MERPVEDRQRRIPAARPPRAAPGPGRPSGVLPSYHYVTHYSAALSGLVPLDEGWRDFSELIESGVLDFNFE